MNKIEQLEKIKKYLDEGIIDLAEFNKLKSEILADENKSDQPVNHNYTNTPIESLQKENIIDEINKLPKDNNVSQKHRNKNRNKKILTISIILLLAILGCLYFFNNNNIDNTGFAVGSRGTIIKTTNGGSNWTVLKSGTDNDLNSVYFIDNKIGFAVGDNGTIIKTIDGGTTWSLLNSGTSDPLGYVQFNDENTGFALTTFVEGGQVLKTTDGGITWTKWTENSGKGRFSSGYFINDKNGYIVGRDGIIKKTTDGGASWIDNNDISLDKIMINFTSPHGEVQWKALKTPSDIGFSSICFLDNNVGYVVGGSIEGSAAIPVDSYGSILKTTNGGTTWIELKSGISNPLNSVYFIDINNGYATGSDGAIIKTTNGGTTWTTLKSGTSIELTSTYFTNINTGYVVGDNGTIIKTIDGGTTWVTLKSGKTNRLNSVYFLNTTIHEMQNDSNIVVNAENKDISNGSKTENDNKETSSSTTNSTLTNNNNSNSTKQFNEIQLTLTDASLKKAELYLGEPDKYEYGFGHLTKGFAIYYNKVSNNGTPKHLILFLRMQGNQWGNNAEIEEIYSVEDGQKACFGIHCIMIKNQTIYTNALDLIYDRGYKSIN